MRCSSALLLACAAACARGPADPGPPAPSSIDPPGAYTGHDAPVLLRGNGFIPAVVQNLGGGGHIAVDLGFRAFLGATELRDVRWIDARTLGAVVPGSLPAGEYALTVQGPYGQGSRNAAFREVDGPPAALAAAAQAPARALTGKDFLVSVVASNAGGKAALRVHALPAQAAGTAATSSTGPESADLAPGASGTFHWTVRATAPGALALTLPVEGDDEVDGHQVDAQAGATVTVLDPSQLVAQAQPAPAAVVVGELFDLSLVVSNAGESDALGVLLDPPSGSSGVRVVAGAPAQDVPAGQSRTFRWTLQALSAGPAALGCAGAGTDATDGSAVAVPTTTWSVIAVQTPASLSAALAVPPSLARGEVFTVSLSVTNSGGAAALGVQASLSLGGAGVLTVESSPAAADVAGGTTAVFSWTLLAAASGAVQLNAAAAGTEANTGLAVSTSAFASTSVADAALLAADPFGDGTAFSYVFSYGGKVWLGPRRDGAGALRMNPDGSGAQAVSLGFNADANGDQNAAPAAEYPSLGYAGCTANTLQCGPDNENGRGWFGSAVVSGTEWLFAVGGYSAGAGSLRHGYATTDLSTAPAFPYVELNGALNSATRAMTALAADGGTVYLGFADTTGGRPVLLALTTMPTAPGLAPSGSQLVSLRADQMPGIGKSAPVSLIDSLAVFNGLLYVANNGGCMRATVPAPAPYSTTSSDWAPCTPSAAAWTAKTSVTTSKTSDFLPSDRAVPGVVPFAGNLYLARNTTTGPQLWACNPGPDLACDPQDWSLLAPDDTGDLQLSTFDDTGVTALSLIAATAQHLYVGYDSPNGLELFRSATTTPLLRSDFRGKDDCPADQHPATCDGLSGAGLGAGLTSILDGEALPFSGTDYLYLTAGAPTGGFKVYRVVQ